MRYTSTRGGAPEMSFSEALLQGLAEDGGLYFPDVFPQVSDDERRTYQQMSYAEVAADLLSRYTQVFSKQELLSACRESYDDFEHRDVAPIHAFDNDTYLLEQFWGPTGAFKDFALQLLPRLMHLAVEKTGADDRCVLVATSGDTGGAALKGFADVPHVSLMCFFPHGMVSPLQQAQMQCALGANIETIELTGDFDNAQAAMKTIFCDQSFTAQVKDQYGVQLSSANSINIGRLLPQVVYYFWTHRQLVMQGKITFDEVIDICVPTGNLGNLFAAFVAQQMGCPLGRFVVASNPNDSSARLIRDGVFDIRDQKTKATISPAMDILRASNLERMLYFMSGRDAEKVATWQQQLIDNQYFEIDDHTKAAMQKAFAGYGISDQETAQMIKSVFDDYQYLVCPHTAVGLAAAQKYRDQHKPDHKLVIAATAHYGKFAKDTFTSLLPSADIPTTEVETLEKLVAQATTPEFPEHFWRTLKQQPVHTASIAGEVDALKEKIVEFLQARKR